MFERITEAEINERSMANVSTTPGRRTAFGEGGLDAKALKLRFDRLGRYLAKRLNEVFDGIADGSLAEVLYIDSKGEKRSLKDFVDSLLTGQVESIKIQTNDGVITLTELGDRTQEMYNGLDTGDLAGKIKIIEGVTLKKFYEDFLKLEDNIAPVKSVNGKTGEVKLSAEDVGARPDTWMPTATEVGARPDTWMPTAQQVGADPSGSAETAVSGHNVQTNAHNDIRLELKRLAVIIADLLDSDDATLDEMHEIVAYIKSNKALIDAITTSKVNVADIINNLDTNVSDKPLSAAQGVALKALIDAGVNSSAGSVIGTWVLKDVYEESADLEFDFTGYVETGYAHTCSRIRIEVYEVDGGDEYTVTFFDSYGNEFFMCDTSESGWVNNDGHIIVIYNEPPIEVSNWIKANTKRYEPIGVERVRTIDTYVSDVAYLNVDDGIYWQDNFAFFNAYEYDGSNIADGTIFHKIPLAAGKNISFEVDEDRGLAVINAEESMIGEWVFNGVIQPPEEPIEISFYSGGSDFSVIEVAGNTLFYSDTIGDTGEPVYNISDELWTEPYQNIKIFKEPSPEATAWVRATARKKSIFETNTSKMPTIRFVGVNYSNTEQLFDGEDEITFTVEITDGEIMAGDRLEICTMRTYHKKENRRIKKLRPQYYRELFIADFGKRFLEITFKGREAKRWIYRNDRKNPENTLSCIFLRIKRVTKYGSEGEECDAIFSNVERVWKEYSKTLYKINFK